MLLQTTHPASEPPPAPVKKQQTARSRSSLVHSSSQCRDTGPTTAAARSRICGEKCKETREEALQSANTTPLDPASERYRAASTRVIAMQHSPAHPMTKPLCQFLSAWKTIPRISCWLLGIIEREYALQFRRRPPCFNGVAQISGPSTERSVSVRSGWYRWNRSWHRFAPETGCVWGFKGMRTFTFR